MVAQLQRCLGHVRSPVQRGRGLRWRLAWTVATLAFLGCACAPPLQATRAELRDVGPGEGIVFGSLEVVVAPATVERFDHDEALPRIPADKPSLTYRVLVAQSPADRTISRTWVPDVYALDGVAGRVTYFAERLPQGEYQLIELRVAAASSRLDERFQVEAGKLSYVGRIRIQMPHWIHASEGSSTSFALEVVDQQAADLAGIAERVDAGESATVPALMKPGPEASANPVLWRPTVYNPVF